MMFGDIGLILYHEIMDRYLLHLPSFPPSHSCQEEDVCLSLVLDLKKYCGQHPLLHPRLFLRVHIGSCFIHTNTEVVLCCHISMMIFPSHPYDSPPPVTTTLLVSLALTLDIKKKKIYFNRKNVRKEVKRDFFLLFDIILKTCNICIANNSAIDCSPGGTGLLPIFLLMTAILAVLDLVVFYRSAGEEQVLMVSGSRRLLIIVIINNYARCKIG